MKETNVEVQSGEVGSEVRWVTGDSRDDGGVDVGTAEDGYLVLSGVSGLQGCGEVAEFVARDEEAAG